MSKVMQNRPKVTNVGGNRFLENPTILVEKLYLPLVLAALSTWQGSRLYLALDTTILWD